MNTVNLKTFKTPEAISNEIQRRAEIILAANRITQRRIDFSDVFFVGSQKGFITFKDNRRVTLARLKEGEWVMPETHVASSARFLACQEMKAARQQSLDAAVSQLVKAQEQFMKTYDPNF